MGDKGKKKRKGTKRKAAEYVELERRAEKGEGIVIERNDRYDFSYTQNRELSWLRFDNRVLDEAFDETVPLYERLKFVAIFHSNLDEFFMIRVGGLSDLADLKHQPVENKSNLTPSEQIDLVNQTLPPLVARSRDIFCRLERELEEYGIERLRPEMLLGDDLTFVEQYFHAYLSPIISPLVIDPRHPFPNLRNGALYLACTLETPDEGDLMGLVEVPASAARVVEVPVKRGASHAFRYILLEGILVACIGSCFGSFTPKDCAVIRVTRNADIDPDGEGVEEEEDYRQHMKRILKKRLRLQPVRLQIAGNLKKRTRTFIRRALELSESSVTQVDMPLDLSYVYSVENRIPEASRPEVLFRPFKPQGSPMFEDGRPLRDQVLEGDKLLFYPYESMDPLLDLVHEAAHDPECISVRITLYRVAKQSRLCESLIAASEAGKEVTVLMELRARFDEENNIEWAGRLDEAGCTVIYGSEGFKCHSKICQITYRHDMKVQRITCLGTGNFNEKTAKLYSDFMLLTAHEGIGNDGNAFFRNLSLGNLKGSYRYLGVAPAGLKPLILTGLNREIERARAGEPARVFFKMNSLTDREVIDKISEASRAGVRVDMIIRGISCLLPGVPGKTDNVHIRSIVGRFLEHARVYSFGVEGDTVYLSSADMMTRNTEHRVEIAYPVLDPVCRKLVETYMQAQLADNVKARVLGADGLWHHVERASDEEPFNSQQHLLLLAYRNAQAVSALPKRTRRKAASAPAVEPAKPAPAPEPAKDAPAPADEKSDAAPAEPVAPAPQPAPAPDAQRVRATVIDPAASKAPENPRTQLVPTHPGRLRAGLALIGLGVKTLLTGSKSASAKPERDKRDKRDEKADKRDERKKNRDEKRRKRGGRR